MTQIEAIKSLKQRLEVHRRNLRHALERQASFGTLYVPTPLLEEIRSHRADVRQCIEDLLQLGEPVPQLPDDIDPEQDQPAEDPGQRLHQALLRLNYRSQERGVRKWLHGRAVAAFIIHGPTDEYGQHWLLNRLIASHTPLSTTAKAITVDLRSALRGADPHSLWRELGRRVGLARGAEPQQIVQRVCQLWATQSVLLIFNNIGQLSPDLLQTLLEQLWQPLARAALAQPDPRFLLLLFLIDNDGMVEAHLPAPAQPPADPCAPLRLEALGRFSKYDLLSWFEQHGEPLLPEPCDDPEPIIEDLLAQTDNGLPKEALVELCWLYQINWYDKEAVWVRYH